MSPAAEARLRAAVAELGDALVAALAEAPTEPAPDRLLGVEEAAKALGIGRSAAYGEMAAGRLRSVRVGRRRLIPSGALAAYVAAAQAAAVAPPR